MKNLKYLLIILMCAASVASLNAQKKDFLMSLLIPGYTQVKNGRTYGYALVAAEALVIGSQLYLKSEANLLKEESYVYAVKYAHINPGDYDQEFLKNLGKYNSSGYDALGYNAAVRAEAMRLYSADPIQQQQYIDDHAYLDDKYFSWETESDRSQYNQMRNKAQDFESFAKLALGVTILNHLISGIDVLRYNAQERRANFSVDVRHNVPQVKLSVKF
ncbi:MAG: hypothetical protein PHN71_03195 [Candidatus Cloacimonetes bacterium]|nr:hypothetical protein [Candidatus Cloacimonadota bacterium]MDD2210310.1 hypothetical protein [Candidatus Cloacimonadota bacterium]